jgi:hypothetical protein
MVVVIMARMLQNDVIAVVAGRPVTMGALGSMDQFAFIGLGVVYVAMIVYPHRRQVV